MPVAAVLPTAQAAIRRGPPARRAFSGAAAKANACPCPRGPRLTSQQPLQRSQARLVVRGTSGGNGAAPEVQAVLFDMDGVLCDSEHISREAAVETMRELYGLTVQAEDFTPFTGRGEAVFLGGVAKQYGAPFEVESCKAKFFEIYFRKAVPGAGIGCPGALELVQACRRAGLRTAVASSADRVKVDASLAAAGIPAQLFDAIVSADAFEQLKPSPDIFLTAAKLVNVPTSACVVIEDAVAGIQAARAAGMRVAAVATSLPRAHLEAAAPDAIFPGIRDIGVDTLTGLQWADQQQAAEALAATART